MHNLETVKTLAEKHPGLIKEGGLRWEIFNKDRNGLAESGAIIKHGGKVLIDSDRYFYWLSTPMQTANKVVAA